jgi:hypothetical protein
MATITIGGTDYTAYQSVAEIDTYAAAATGDAAVAWRAADPDTKARGGVSASRSIDRLAWSGAKTDPAQTPQWPRTGLTYPDGTPVDPETNPQQLLDANSEMAMMMVAGVDPQAGANTIRRQKAGSVEVEYFRELGVVGKFPTVILELVGFWLGGGLAAETEATGVCEPSAFRSSFGLNRGF